MPVEELERVEFVLKVLNQKNFLKCAPSVNRKFAMIVLLILNSMKIKMRWVLLLLSYQKESKKKREKEEGKKKRNDTKTGNVVRCRSKSNLKKYNIEVCYWDLPPLPFPFFLFSFPSSSLPSRRKTRNLTYQYSCMLSFVGPSGQTM
mgnify:CR=1 FL=1